MGLILLLITRIPAKPAGSVALITVEGREYARLPLDKDTVLTVTVNDGTNTVKVADGRIYVESADCPDKICVGHKGISRCGETIVCLPHKVVIEIPDTCSEDTDFDAVSE
ncbi:MAG: NusG domain II-containing protein [Lachnospiraceae bacterium]|nr:NusG domain II-containing protein [Lachnospiraceae bacterium]